MRELDLPGNRLRHGAPARIEVRDVDDPYRHSILGGAQRQLARAGFALLADADHKVDAAPLAERHQPIVLGALLDPHLDDEILPRSLEPVDVKPREMRKFQFPKAELNSGKYATRDRRFPGGPCYWRRTSARRSADRSARRKESGRDSGPPRLARHRNCQSCSVFSYWRPFGRRMRTSAVDVTRR